MRRWLKLQDGKSRAVVFGLLPCVLGLGAARYLHWTDTVWLTTAGSAWPIVLSTLSCAILIKLMLSPFKDGTVSLAAWLILAWTWFDLPLWVTARDVPYAAAVVGADGRVHVVSEAVRERSVQGLVPDRPFRHADRAQRGRQSVHELTRARVSLCQALHRDAPR